jgi:hypothetical protein
MRKVDFLPFQLTWIAAARTRHRLEVESEQVSEVLQ